MNSLTKILALVIAIGLTGCAPRATGVDAVKAMPGYTLRSFYVVGLDVMSPTAISELAHRADPSAKYVYTLPDRSTILVISPEAPRASQ